MRAPYAMTAVLPGKSAGREHPRPRRNTVVAEYALRDLGNPSGVAEYALVDSLPKDLELNLPSIEAIQQALSSEDPSTVQYSTETNP